VPVTTERKTGFEPVTLLLEREGTQKEYLATKPLGKTRRTDQKRASEKPDVGLLPTDSKLADHVTVPGLESG
jgi:hypothetical protein